jgi:AraC-like DNA-binding protein
MAASVLHNLTALIDRHTAANPALDTHDTAIPELRLYRLPEPSRYPAVVYEPSLYIVARGAKEVILDGKAYRYDPAQALLVSVDLPVAARVVEASATRPCLVARIRLDPAVVGELIADGSPNTSEPSARGLAVAPVAPPLLDAVHRLVALLDTPRDISALAPLALREIAYRVLTGPQGARLRQIAAAGAPAQRIAKAIRWLMDHYSDQLFVGSLTRHVRMSPSAFHLHFKSVTGLSPLQYQKRLRLQEARRLLLGEGLDAGDAGFQVGYSSPSQFSREYRRMFGSPPRQDVDGIVERKPLTGGRNTPTPPRATARERI